MKTIDKILYFISALAVGGFISCAKEDIGVDKATDISLSPASVQFAASGKTADGKDAYIGCVTIKEGNIFNSQDFTVEVNKTWASVEKVSVENRFNETYSDAEYLIIEPGVKIKVKENQEYRRSFNLTVTASDGTVSSFQFEQLGLKEDAKIALDSESLEFISDGQTLDFGYTTNMPEISFEVEYEGDSKDWLSTSVKEAAKVEVTALPWDGKEPRTAVLKVIAGTPETSVAEQILKVVQLGAKDYYYIYGASVGVEVENNAIKMKEEVEGELYSCRLYFMKSEDGKNRIVLRKNISDEYFALSQDGKIVTLSDKDTEQQGPVIDIDGMRSLSVDFSKMEWSWERISTQNCLPDSEVSKYKTKEYIARDGSKKVWMVEHFAWDGGDIQPKLGSGMYKIATGGADGSGGYGAADFPASWNDASKLDMTKESAEIGGNLEVTSEYGRIYTFHEMVTGEPRYGIGYARYETSPEGWREGDKYTDAIGRTYDMEAYPVGKNTRFTGDNDSDEANFPLLTVQAQGICPYGWHIANASDWLDLFYAMADASSGDKYPVSKADINYKKMTDGGVPNIAAWLRNKDWNSSTVADGADAFGFNYYPLGWRYMTQGYMWFGVRMQIWVPMLTPSSKSDYFSYSTARLNVIIGGSNTSTTTALTNFDNGQAVCGFRCVKNYIE